MLTRILHNSPGLCTFIGQLELSLSQPQLWHVINMADALLVCDSDKTLAELQRQFVGCVDASNMADTLRIAPWTAAEVRRPVSQFMIRTVLARARAAGSLDAIYVSLDDSIARKHKHTRHIEPVDWHFDHVESTPHKPRHANGLAYLDCNVWIGGEAITFDVRMYLREKTVRRINRHHAPDEGIGFLSKMHLARTILQALRPLLPDDIPVYVLHDAWYASARLIKFTHQQGWHTITALKHNRKLDGQRLDQHSLALRHQRYEHVSVTATDGTKTPYFTRTFSGRLQDLAFGLLRLYGFRPGDASGSPDLRQSLGMRDRQCLSENPVGPGRFSGAPLRRSRQIRRRGSPDLGLCAVALPARTLGSDTHPGRHHPAISGRARLRLAHRRLSGSHRHRRYRDCPPAVLAPQRLAARQSQLAPSSLLTGRQMPLRRPAVDCALRWAGKPIC